MKLNTSTFCIITLFFAFVLTSSVMAQNGTIRGFVYEQETGEPVIFTNVYLKGTTFGSATDVNGYFVISQIVPGDYLLMVTYLGYDTLQMTVSVRANEIISKQLYLEKGAYMLEQVQVSAEREEARSETRTSVVKLTPKQIDKIPSLGGKPDLAQYLQVLPGVVFTGDQGGQLYIRGGSPIQNKVLLDGMIIYNPFHSIGLFSVFDTDILRNADVYTGGFGAEYGGRISSVMDITTRDGNKTRMSGKVGASTFGANMMIEGPLKKMTDDAKGSSSFILSAKNSYLEQSSEVFYDYIDTAGLPFNYTDLYGKVSLMAANGSKVNFFGFSFNDRVNNYKSLSDFSWESYGGGTNFLIIPGNSPVLMEGHVAYSSYKITLEEANNLPRESSINGFNMGFDFTYFIGKDGLKYGFEILGFKTNYLFHNSLGLEIAQEDNTTEIGAYVKYKKTMNKFLLEPSFRFQWYASLSNLSLEPRLAMKYNITDNFRVKFAGGLYSQNLISARNDRDVVNLFYGFLSGPDNLPSEFNGNEVTHKLQKSQHAILGFEYDLTQFITVNLEGYYKNFSQLTNLNRNKMFEDNSENIDVPDQLKKDFMLENGYATGMDATFKYENKQFYFWAVYSLGYVTKRYDDINGELQSYHPHYDRRHNINLVATYTFGGKKDWEVNARWNFGSGFPFTLSQGYYELLPFQEGINSDYTTANGDVGILYDELNAGRLSTYHRMDIGIKKMFTLGRYTKLEVSAGATNIYDRENIFYVERLSGERIYQLPIMPSIGMNFSF